MIMVLIIFQIKKVVPIAAKNLGSEIDGITDSKTDWRTRFIRQRKN